MENNKRYDILLSTQYLFSKNGFKNTRIDEVTKMSGCSKGLVYYFFRSKEDILDAVVTSSVEQFSAKLDILEKSKEKINIKGLLEWCLDILLSNIPFWKLSFQIFFCQKGCSNQFKDILQNVDCKFFAFLTRYFFCLDEKNPIEKSNFFMALLNGLFFNMIFLGQKIRTKEIEIISDLFRQY